MYRRRILAVSWFLLSLAGPAGAEMIQDGCIDTCDFRAWSVLDLNQDGNPYFDNPSLDGFQKNVGYFLTGTGGFGGNPNSPGAAIPYYGTLAGAPALNYYFSADPAQTFALSLLLEVAGGAATNQFGWYVAGDRNSRTVLFGGAASAGAKTSFAPGTDFGFYLATGSGQIFFTESSLNGTAAGADPRMAFQQMALFGDSAGSLWLAVEDLRHSGESSQNGSRVGDFNDMVVRIAPVPEPGTLSLFGAVVIVLGLVQHRRTKLRGDSSR